MQRELRAKDLVLAEGDEEQTDDDPQNGDGSGIGVFLHTHSASVTGQMRLDVSRATAILLRFPPERR